MSGINKLECAALTSPRDWALFMARVGFRVCPLKPDGKAPFDLAADIESGAVDAKYRPLCGGPRIGSRDPQKIGSWFDLYPEINYGVVPDKHYILDIDVKGGKQGNVQYFALDVCGYFPDTLTVKTPTTGKHVYFSSVEQLSGAKLPDCPDIDIRTGMNYVVGPGSIIGGQRYEMVCPVAPAALPDEIRALAKRAPAKRESAGPPSGDLDRPLNVERARRYLAELPPAQTGHRNHECYSRASMLKDLGLSCETAIELMDDVWRCDEPLSVEEITATVESAYSCGQNAIGCRDPYVEFADVFELLATIPELNRSEAVALGYEARCFADITQKPIDWLWYLRIALGKLTLLAGVPKLGKSQLTCAFAAPVTTGGLWPDGSRAPLGSVVFITAEDDAADTIGPRLTAAGADLRKVHLLDWAIVRGKDGKLAKQHFDVAAHMDALRKLVEALGDVKLIVIDPVLAYMGKADSHKTGDVRAALLGLQTLVADLGVAGLLVTHLNKNDCAGQSAMNRISASGAFVGVARAVWLVAKDPEDETGARRLMAPVGANVGNDRDGFAFRIEGVDLGNRIETSKAVFESEPISTDADEIIQPKDASVQEAARLLKAALANGERTAKEVTAEICETGVSQATLRRAQRKVPIRRRMDGKAWFWRLATAADPETEFGDMPGG